MCKVSVPQVGTPQSGVRLRLLRPHWKGESASLEDYRQSGGYEALRKAIEIGPEETCAK